MEESGVDLDFDLVALASDELDFDCADLFNENDNFSPIGRSQSEFTYYELKSKTVPGSSPTFKTATTTSRTQLKLQLMKQQLQEQERREAEMRQQKEQQLRLSNATSNKVPVTIQDIAMDVPPQVLQVKTVLENPTRYHVIQKQKSQVRQFLSESLHQQPVVGSSCGNTGGRSVKSTGDVGIGGSVFAVPPLGESYRRRIATTSSPERVVTVSPGVSSVATSTSEAEDLIEDILSFEQSSLASDAYKVSNSGLNNSSDMQFATSDNLFSQLIPLAGGNVGNKTSISCPPDLDAPNIKSEPLHFSDAELNAYAKDRQKKDTHNMIERRRRYKINDQIKELGTLLPKNNDLYHEVIRDSRPNKGNILKSSVEYIKILKHDSQRMKQIEMRQKQLEHENRALRLKVQELEMRVKVQDGTSVSPVTEPMLHSSAPTLKVSFVKPKPLRSGSLERVPEVVNTISQVEDLMDDDHPVTGDPMLSSPIVPSPDSVSHFTNMSSYDNLKTIDDMDHLCVHECIISDIDMCS
ncbi:microphthalmia-associated transcription factor isoform X2 [Bacillus rossius redtenbacheri]|uniref:microphthalmia-associated transcription factor isoform X2 n=1 Tax=Bacillus rossius redtenbacheri TaxID=93214 RepID=UPI002FDD5410